MQDIRNNLDDLFISVGQLSSAHAVWKELVLVENYENHEIVVERFKPFFSTIVQSLHEQVVVGIFRLIDQRSDVNSLYQIAKKIRETEGIDSQNLAIKTMRDLKKGDEWTTIRVLRGNVYGHKNKGKSIKEFYSQVNITSEYLDNRISYLRSTIDEFYYSLFNTRLDYRYQETAFNTNKLMSYLVGTLANK